MIFDILTLFPNSFSYLNESMIKKAQEKGLITINIHDLRKWSKDKHKKVDDRPFSGGPGMLMQIEPIYNALKDLGVYPERGKDVKVILTSAKGLVWNQNVASSFVKEGELSRMVVICGHYEGVDNRVSEHLIDEEVSIGQFVLSGGELPAMIIIDSIARLIKGVLGSEDSAINESYSDGNLHKKEYPQYTRPEKFLTDEGEEWSVPEVLLSGHHKAIEDWKKVNSNS